MLCVAGFEGQPVIRRRPLRLESAELLRARVDADVMDDDGLVVVDLVVDLRAKFVRQDELLGIDRGELCKRERKLRFELLTSP